MQKSLVKAKTQNLLWVKYSYARDREAGMVEICYEPQGDENVFHAPGDNSNSVGK